MLFSLKWKYIKNWTCKNKEIYLDYKTPITLFFKNINEAALYSA